MMAFMINPSEIELELWLRSFSRLIEKRFSRQEIQSGLFLGFHPGLLELHHLTGLSLRCMSQDSESQAIIYPWLLPVKSWDEVSDTNLIFILSRRSFSKLREIVPEAKRQRVFVPSASDVLPFVEWSQNSQGIVVHAAEPVLPVNNPDHRLFQNIDLGGGFPLNPEYLCVDLSKQAQLNTDITKPLPFLSNSLKNVNCAHTLEHLSVTDSLKVCQEVYRCLMPGGVFRVSVPDLFLFSKKYVEQDRDFYEEILPDGTYHYPGYTLADRFMYIAYDSGHQYFFDTDSLTHLLKRAGFMNVYPCEYQKGRLYLVEHMDNRPGQSLYVEAVK